MKTLKELRLQYNLTLKELSRYTHLSMPYLSKLENGKANLKPDSEFYQSIKKFYGEDFIIERSLSPKETKLLLDKLNTISNENSRLKNKLKLLEDELDRIMTIFDPRGCDEEEH